MLSDPKFCPTRNCHSLGEYKSASQSRVHSSGFQGQKTRTSNDYLVKIKFCRVVKMQSTFVPDTPPSSSYSCFVRKYFATPDVHTSSGAVPNRAAIARGRLAIRCCFVVDKSRSVSQSDKSLIKDRTAVPQSTTNSLQVYETMSWNGAS